MKDVNRSSERLVEIINAPYRSNIAFETKQRLADEDLCQLMSKGVKKGDRDYVRGKRLVVEMLRI